MIKTLRITSIIAVVLAVFLFVLPAVFGVRGDKQIEQFLNSAGAIEEFRAARGGKVEDKRNETSPLVKQAEAFALYLNPPPKPKPEPAVSGVKSKPRPAGPVAAKFKLVGTSRHVLQPELSLALIDEPGKGLYWVRQSSKVGHLIIEQIRDGLVVVRDGNNTFELVAERPEKRSFIKAPALAAQAAAGEVQVSAGEKEMTETEAKKALAELDAAMQAKEDVAKADVQVDETGSSKAKEIAAVKKRSVSDLETMRISAREARGLGRLGRRLKNVQQEPNRVEDNSAERDANLSEPILNDANITGQG